MKMRMKGRWLQYVFGEVVTMRLKIRAGDCNIFYGVVTTRMKCCL